MKICEADGCESQFKPRVAWGRFCSYRCKNAQATRRWREKSDTEYGITRNEYRVLLESQKRVCRVCGRDNGKRKLCIDHCHKTGIVRGLLCDRCNMGLGLLNEDPKRIRKLADYAEFWRFE